MDIRDARLWAAGAVLLLSAAPLVADSVKLDGGGTLNGSVTMGSKSVSVRTPTGAVFVFDRSAVKQVTHGRTSTPKNSNSPNASAKSQPKKRKLTPEEEVWMPKLRALVSRLYGGDREKSRRARTELLNIDDPDAIPALSTYLGSSGNVEARHLYVMILHNMKGPKPVYYLVALSLYDSSPQIRSEARRAIREDQLDSARLLYIAALRSGPPKLARIAAIGLGEIGDPRGDSVPYLINALISYGTVATMTEPAQYGLLYNITISATPGLNLSNLSNSGLIYAGQGPASIYLTPAGTSLAEAALKKATGPGQSLGIGGTIYVPSPVGGQVAQDFSPNSKGMPHLQLGDAAGTANGPYVIPKTPTLNLYDLPIVGQVAPAHEKRIRGRVDHPEVLDALLKITDQKHPGYGFNQDRWRQWWANEKTNRDLQKPPTPDRVLLGGSPAH
jgi:hypothetical protein